jgi:hypothetical protein
MLNSINQDNFPIHNHTEVMGTKYLKVVKDSTFVFKGSSILTSISTPRFRNETLVTEYTIHHSVWSEGNMLINK